MEGAEACPLWRRPRRAMFPAAGGRGVRFRAGIRGWAVLRKSLGDMLLEANLIDPVQLQIALREQKGNHLRLGSTLVSLRFVDENVLAAFLSKQTDIPCISLLNIELPSRVLRVLKPEDAHRLQAIPVRFDGSTLFLALEDPFNVDVLDEASRLTGLQVQPFIAPQSSINAALRRFYPLGESAAAEPDASTPGAIPGLLEEVESESVVVARLRRIEKRLDKLEGHSARILAALEKLAGTPHDQ